MLNRISGLRHLRITVVGALCLAIAMSLLPVSVGAGPVALAAGACVDGWRRVPLTNAAEFTEPLGAAALNGMPAWIVGRPLGDIQRPRILRWRTDQWVSVTPPWSRYGSLNAVHATAPNVAWAVGNIGHPVGTAIVGKWDGTSWTKVGLPALGGATSTFADVISLSSAGAWVVGGKLVNGQMKPLALRRGPSGWAKLSPAVNSAQEAGLTAAEQAPGGRIWIGGWRTEDGLQRPWLMYRNSTAWAQVPIAAVDGPAAITDLAFRAADDGWLVGYVENAGGGGYVPLLQHWNGSSWSNVDAPWVVGDSVALNSVSVDGGGRLIVAGLRLKAGERRAALAVLDGATWAVREVPGSLNPKSSFLTGGAGLTQGAFVVGDILGGGAVLATCNGSGFVTAPTSGPEPSSPDPIMEEDLAAAAAALPNASVAAVAIDGLVARNRTAAAGLTLTTDTFGGVVADFNVDGYPDVFINRHVEDVPRLMLGSATGTFTLLDAPWLWADRHGCSVADVDLDTMPDLFCSVGANVGTRATGSELVLHPGDGEGVIATSDYGILNAWGRGRHATFFNLDGDAYPDLYITTEPERIDAIQSANRLFRNVDGDYFDPEPSWQLNRSMGGNCAAAADIDGDGDDELLICVTKRVDVIEKGARLYLNDSGTMVERTTAWGLTPMFDVDIEVADFDADGKPDVAQLARSLLRVNLQRDGKFKSVYTFSLTRAVAMAVGDVNGDDRPDIYISQQTAGNDDHVMLINNGNGNGFTSFAIPHTVGSANDVVAIDHDGNGLSDFVVLNGRYVPGPIALVAFYIE